jgi:SAM-dependent methyltransferase
MPKQAEIEYLAQLGAAGVEHARGKPYTNSDCGTTLVAMGTIMALLPPPPGRLLDLGCGSGWTSVMFAQRGYIVVGQDLAPAMIELANENKRRSGLENLGFVVADYEVLDFRDEFDCAVFFDALHHAEDETAALSSAFRALKPGGTLITHEPGEGHAVHPASIDAMQRFGVTEREMPPHRIMRVARKIGYRGARCYPLPDDLFRASYLSPRAARFPGAFGRAVRCLEYVRYQFHRFGRRGGLVVLTK